MVRVPFGPVSASTSPIFEKSVSICMPCSDADVDLVPATPWAGGMAPSSLSAGAIEERVSGREGVLGMG